MALRTVTLTASTASANQVVLITEPWAYVKITNSGANACWINDVNAATVITAGADEAFFLAVGASIVIPITTRLGTLSVTAGTTLTIRGQLSPV